MSDATYIELPPVRRKKPFFKSWKGIALTLFALAALLSGTFSWWLATGRVVSAYANVEASVYTVAPGTAVIVREILAAKGSQVFAGQPLAVVDYERSPQKAQQPANDHAVMPMEEITGRLQASEQAEMRMSAQIAQARAQEERYLAVHQERVTEHVRAQLALRATNPGDPVAYATYRQEEALARSRMEAAREQYEQVSKMRAAMDAELARIRAEIFRKKARASKTDVKPVKAPKPAPSPAPVETTLISPATGKIAEIYAAPGQLAQPGQPLFFILPESGNQPRNIWIQAWFPISDKDLIKPGQKVLVRSDAWKFTGTVAAIEPEAQKMRGPQGASPADSVRYLSVQIQPENPEALSALAPGTSVKCQIQTRYIPGMDWLFAGDFKG